MFLFWFGGRGRRVVVEPGTSRRRSPAEQLPPLASSASSRQWVNETTWFAYRRRCRHATGTTAASILAEASFSSRQRY